METLDGANNSNPFLTSGHQSVQTTRPKFWPSQQETSANITTGHDGASAGGADAQQMVSLSRVPKSVPGTSSSYNAQHERLNFEPMNFTEERETGHPPQVDNGQSDFYKTPSNEKATYEKNLGRITFMSVSSAFHLIRSVFFLFI